MCTINNMKSIFRTMQMKYLLKETITSKNYFEVQKCLLKTEDKLKRLLMYTVSIEQSHKNSELSNC